MDQTRWFSEETEVDRLKRQLAQKDIDYANLKEELDAKSHEIEVAHLGSKDAVYKLQVEASRATKLEADLEKKKADYLRERVARQNLETSLDAAQQRIKDKERSLSQIQLELDNYHMHSSGSSAQVSQLTKERDELRAQVKLLKNSQRSQEALLAEAHAEKERLLSQSSGSAPAILGCSTGEAHSTRPRASSVSGDIRVTRLEMELEDARRNYAVVDAKLKKLQSDLLLAENSKLALEATSQKEISRLKDELEDHLYDLNALREQLQYQESNQGDFSHEEVMQLQQENASLRSSLDRLQQPQRDTTPSMGFDSETRAELNQLRVELNSLQRQLEASQEEASRLRVVSLKTVDVDTRMASPIEPIPDSVWRELEAAREDARKAKLELQIATAERQPVRVLNDLRQALADVSDDRDAKVEELKELQDVFNAAQTEIETLESAKRRLEDELETMRAAAVPIGPVGDLLDASFSSSTPIRDNLVSLNSPIIKAPAVCSSMAPLSLSHRRRPSSLVGTPRQSRRISDSHYDARKVSQILDAVARLRDERNDLQEKLHFLELEVRFGATPGELAKEQRIAELQAALGMRSESHLNKSISMDPPPEEELKEHIEDLSKELEKRSEAADQAEEAEDVLYEQLDKLSATLQEIEAERDHLKSEVERLQRTVRNLRADATNVTEGPLPKDAELTSLQERVDRRNHQIALHQHDIQRMKMNLGLAQESYADFEEERQEMMDELQRLEGERVCLIEDSETARTERDAAKMRLEEAVDAQETLRDRIRELEESAGSGAEVPTLVRLIIQQVQRTRHLQSQITELQEQVSRGCDHSEYEAALSAATAAHASQAEEILFLENTKAHLIETNEKALEDLKALHDALKAEQERSRDFADMVADNERLRNAVSELHASIDNHECPAQQLDECRSQLSELTEQAVAEREEHSRQVEAMEKDSDGLRQNLDDLKLSQAALKRSYDELSYEYSQATAQLRQAERDLEDAHTVEHEREEFEAKRGQELEILKGDLRDAKQAMDELHAQLQELDEEKAQAVGELQEGYKQLERDMDAMHEELMRKTDQLSALQEVHDLQGRTSEKLAAELRQENSGLVQKLSKLQEELNLLRESRSKDAQWSEEIRKKLQVEMEARRKASDEIVTLRAQLEKRSAAVSNDSDGESAHWKERFEATEAKCRVLENQVEDADDKCLELQKQEKKYKARISKLERERDYFKDIVDANPVAKAKSSAPAEPKPILAPSQPTTTAATARVNRPPPAPETVENIRPTIVEDHEMVGQETKPPSTRLNMPPIRKANPNGGLRLPPGTSMRLNDGAVRPVLRALNPRPRIESSSSTNSVQSTGSASSSSSNSKKRAREDDVEERRLPAAPMTAESLNSTPSSSARIRRALSRKVSPSSHSFTPTRSGGVKDLVAKLESNSRPTSPERPPRLASPTKMTASESSTLFSVSQQLPTTMRPILNFRPRSPGVMRTRMEKFAERHPH